MTVENTIEIEKNKFNLALPIELKSELESTADAQGETTQRMIEIFLNMKLIVDEAEGKEKVKTERTKQGNITKFNFNLKDSDKARIAEQNTNITAYLVEAIRFGLEKIKEVSPDGRYVVGIPLETKDKDYLVIF